jgi:hypothetical protein
MDKHCSCGALAVLLTGRGAEKAFRFQFVARPAVLGTVGSEQRASLWWIARQKMQSCAAVKPLLMAVRTSYNRNFPRGKGLI